MKNLIIFLSIAVFTMGCKRDEIEYVFGESPEDRVGQLVSDLQSNLVDAPHGWKAALNTNSSGGYGFYMDFSDEQTLKMLSDFSVAASNTLKSSTYRTTWTMNAALMFDTYNYITLLQDPTPSVNGGTAGNGLRSDIEFELRKISADTIRLEGKRYANMLTLVKLTQTEQESYLNGNLSNSIAAVNGYFSSHTNNYLNIDGFDNKVEFVLTTTKGVVFQYVANDDKVESIVGKFNYELNGINFNVPIEVGESRFVRGILESGDFYLITDRNMRLKINQNTQPILPIETLFAYNKTYNTIYNSTALPVGVSSDFNAIFNQSLNLFAAMNPARHIIQCYFKLTSSTKAEVGVQNRVSPSGTTYAIGLATFDYVMDESGVITLSNPIYDSNFTNRLGQLSPIRDYFLSGPFKLIYVTSTDPNVSNIAGLQRVSQPTSFFYGSLRKM